MRSPIFFRYLRFLLPLILLFLVLGNSIAGSDNRAIKLQGLGVPADLTILSPSSPMPDTIAYDNNEAAYIRAFPDIWVGVRFTPLAPFDLQAIYLGVFNDYPNTTDGCSLYVVQDDGSGYPDWPGGKLAGLWIAPPLADMIWMQADLISTIQFMAGEDFHIIYGPVPGGAYPGAGWWSVYDSDGSTSLRSNVSEDNRGSWSTVTIGDTFVRAGGEYTPQVLINEVLYWPMFVPGDTIYDASAWVELFNAGTDTVSLDGWVITDKEANPLAVLEDVVPILLPDSQYIRVYFRDGVNEYDYSDDEASFFVADADSMPFDVTEDAIALYSGSPGEEAIIDFVHYSASGSYNPGLADNHAVGAEIWTYGEYVDTDSLVERESFGRMFNGLDLDRPGDWMIYNWIIYRTTSQQWNPAQIVPTNGSVIDDNTPTLTWRDPFVGWVFPAGWRAVFRVEVDGAATDVLIAGYTTPVLAEGRHTWRVRAGMQRIADGNIRWRSTWTALWSFSIFAGGNPPGAVTLANIVHDFQHKDTKLVCLVDWRNGNHRGCLFRFHKTLANQDPTGRHDWVSPHNVTQFSHVRECPHCDWYCSEASISMVNRYYQATHKKKLSQDYISYHVFKSKAPAVGGPGRNWGPSEPEGDISHNSGFSPAYLSEAMAWALGFTVVGNPGEGDTKKIQVIQNPNFAAVSGEIDTDRPIIAHNGRHVIVIYGHATAGGNNYIRVDDPAIGQSWYQWGAYNLIEIRSPKVAVVPANVKSDPAGVGGDYHVAGEAGYGTADKVDDADGDRLCDFDGDNRLHSVKNNPDTDGDHIDDYHEVWSYTFGRSLRSTPSTRDPDVDDDNKNAENDADTDGGGVDDGKEDINGNGIGPVVNGDTPLPAAEAGESDPFDDNAAQEKNVGDACKHDYGDAPSPYPTKKESDGARHKDGTMEWMGRRVSGELDANDPNDPDGEPNLNPEDTDHWDDGVYLYPSYTPGTGGFVEIVVSTWDAHWARYEDNTDNLIYLHGWFDWNLDRDWNDPGENVFSGYTVDPSTWPAGINWNSVTITFAVPADVVHGECYARFRLDYGQNLNDVMGRAHFGEVEDYLFTNSPGTSETCPAPGPDDWSTHAHDYARTSATTMEVGNDPCNISLVWKANTTRADMHFNNVSVTGGKVYCSDEQTIHCFDLATGSLAWRYYDPMMIITGTSMRNNLTIYGNRVFGTGGITQSFFCLDTVGSTGNGVLHWGRYYNSHGGGTADWLCGAQRFAVSVALNVGPDSVVFVGDEAGCLWSLNMTDGLNYPGWATNPIVLSASGPIYHSPAYDGGTNLYVATVLGDIYKVNIVDGSHALIFSAPPGEEFRSGCSYDSSEDVIYAASFDAGGGVPLNRYKIASDGTLIWSAAQGNSLYSPATIGRNNVYFGQDNPDDGLLMVDKATGMAIYDFAADGVGMVTNPVTLTCDNYLFAGDREGGWHLLDVETPAEVWCRRFQDYVWGTALAYHSVEDKNYALMSIFSDVATEFQRGAVFCWELNGIPRPRMELLVSETTIEVPAGTGMVYDHSETDVILNGAGCADLNITGFQVFDYAEPTSVQMTTGTAKVPAANAKGVQEAGGNTVGSDYLSFFKPQSNLIKRGLIKQEASAAMADFETADRHQRRARFEKSKERLAAMSDQSNQIRTSNVRLNPAGSIAGGQTAGLLWDYDGTGLTEGATDVEIIQFNHDDPDFNPEWFGNMPSVEIIVTYVGVGSCYCGDAFGDVNCDGQVNPLDVVFMVNFVYKNFDQRCADGWICLYDPGDVNCDSAVNPVDVVHYVNYVYKNITPFPCGGCE